MVEDEEVEDGKDDRRHAVFSGSDMSDPVNETVRSTP